MNQSVSRPTLSTQVFQSASRKLKKLIKVPVQEPYMVQREIDILIEILTKLQPLKCLEYGSGYSTLFFPQFIHPEGKWFSVEHHKTWPRRVKDMNKNPNVGITHVDTKNDGSLDNYVHAMDKMGPFDFILVDGITRLDCILKAIQQLTPDGILVVHDANRREYPEALTIFPYRLVLEDFRRTSGGIAFATQHNHIGHYFNLRKHALLWYWQTLLMNGLKFKFHPGLKAKPFRLFSPSKID